MPQPRIAVAAIVALVLGACAENRDPSGPDPAEPQRPLVSAELAVASASNSFGIGLLQQVSRSEAKPNVLLSPLSASMALGMTMNGARGSTYDAMRDALGFKGLAESEINAAYRGLIGQLRGRDPKVEFGLANAIWYRQEFPVQKEFVDTVRAHFDAKISPLDFANPTAPKTISGWAEQQTGGRIKDLVETIDPLDVMFLVNAVYFKAPWAMPFHPNSTRPGAFRRADGSSIQVPTMSQDGAFASYADAEVKLVELMYADSAYSMVLLAPASAGTSLASVTAGITSTKWDGWMERLQSGRIVLRMPKFRYEYDIELNDALKAMGMGIAFAPRQADFGRINPAAGDLHISKVRQKAFIDVHELGTEAAAATSVTMSLTSMPPEFSFDRPFVYAIRDRASGTLLFVGRMGDPSAK